MEVPIDRYWLVNATIPLCLLNGIRPEVQPNSENLATVDLEIRDGKITAIAPVGKANYHDVPTVNLRYGMVIPCFVDLHTHLDKGHTWNRTPNPDGSFDGALQAVNRDRDQHLHFEDIYRRMEFGIKCSYAHGTKAIRTHIDCPEQGINIGLDAFAKLRDRWQERIALQAVSLVTLDYFGDQRGEILADRIADLGGILGGVAYMHPELETHLDRIFAIAQERNLDLDFHVDENGDPASECLRYVAEAALRHKFTGQIVCGHCCSLAVQNPAVAERTIDLVKQAGIAVVSLPMCNLYLQDRGEFETTWGISSKTPKWRGVTLLHELKAKGVPVAIASDNCRDPFYGFGDHDGLEVFAMAVRIAHLDMPYGNWLQTVTTTPANIMGLVDTGHIGIDTPADLILFKARNFSELLSRSQRDRTVLRNGKAIDTTLPDYAELDDLIT